MPPYNSNPGVNTPVKILQPGVVGYAFGSRDSAYPTTLMQVTNVALTGNVATVTVLVREGKIPDVNGEVTIRGTTSTSGLFNVVDQQISTVNIDPVTGIGTITFVLTHVDVVSAPDTGMAYVPVPEVGELLGSGGSSQAFAIQNPSGHNENGLTLQWDVWFPSQPSGCTLTLEVADVDDNDQYVQLDSTNATTVDSRSITLTRVNFVRVTSSGISGGSNPSVVARLLI